MHNNIGNMIRDLRIDQRLTLKDISEKTGLSISFLSQVERSKSSVTLRSLTRIADALGVSQSYFFKNQTEDSPIKKSDQERELDFQNTNFIYKGLTGQIDDPVFSPMLVVLLPGDHDELLSTSSHDGEEFAYVLSGELTVKIGDRISELREGDSFHIKS